jgi:hypothetical protein
VVVNSVRVNGESTSATVDRINDLGWISKVRLSLVDGQPLTAEVPNERLDGLRTGQTVFVDLRNAKVFPPAGSSIAVSDELAAL